VRRLFHLDHDAGLAADDLARLGDVGRLLHERQCHPVDVQRQGIVQIGEVFLGEWRERDDGVGQVDALARRQHAAEHHAGGDDLAVSGGDLQPDAAVIEQQVLAGLHGGEDFGVGQADAGCITRGFVHVEAERVAGLDGDVICREGADAQLGALQVDHDGDGAGVLLLDGADVFVTRLEVVVIGVAHVDAEHINTGEKQLLDHLRRGRGRAQGCNDLGLTLASHGRAVLVIAAVRRDRRERRRGGCCSYWVGAAVVLAPSSLMVQSRFSPVSTSKKPVWL
jgi:hypothetical protein